MGRSRNVSGKHNPGAIPIVVRHAIDIPTAVENLTPDSDRIIAQKKNTTIVRKKKLKILETISILTPESLIRMLVTIRG